MSLILDVISSRTGVPIRYFFDPCFSGFLFNEEGRADEITETNMENMLLPLTVLLFCEASISNMAVINEDTLCLFFCSGLLFALLAPMPLLFLWYLWENTRFLLQKNFGGLRHFFTPNSYALSSPIQDPTIEPGSSLSPQNLGVVRVRFTVP